MCKLITLIFGIVSLMNAGFAFAYCPDKIGLQNSAWLKAAEKAPSLT
jgi:hypothetical protein